MSTIALDIETISPDDASDVDFLDSRDFEILCVGVGYRATPTSPVETDVIWRPGLDIGDEYQALAETAEWLHNHHAEQLLTFNGSSFDERHLKGRANIVAEDVGDPSLAEVIHRGFQTQHRDLMYDIVRLHGHRMSLEDAVEQHVGERPPTVTWNGEDITNRDIPALGRTWLLHRSGLSQRDDAAELKTALAEYVRADIEPLFALLDALNGREHNELGSTETLRDP